MTTYNRADVAFYIHELYASGRRDRLFERCAETFPGLTTGQFKGAMLLLKEVIEGRAGPLFDALIPPDPDEPAP